MDGSWAVFGQKDGNELKTGILVADKMLD